MNAESKEGLMKNVQNSINREKTDDKRKLSKIKAQKLISILLELFKIEIPEKLLNNPNKLKDLFEEGKAEELFPNCLNSEKRIVIIIDNFSVHKTYLSRIACLILNIKLIFLPVYSPFLNPIEQVWRTIKNILHKNSIPNIFYLISKSTELYLEEVDKTSYTKIWIEKFIAKN
jgi:transposase